VEKPCDGAIRSTARSWRQEWFVAVEDIWDFVSSNGPCIVSIDEYGQAEIEVYDAHGE
jgi:hypothetical protein